MFDFSLIFFFLKKKTSRLKITATYIAHNFKKVLKAILIIIFFHLKNLLFLIATYLFQQSDANPKILN